MAFPFSRGALTGPSILMFLSRMSGALHAAVLVLYKELSTVSEAINRGIPNSVCTFKAVSGAICD